jgi:hypothetical protein
VFINGKPMGRGSAMTLAAAAGRLRGTPFSLQLEWHDRRHGRAGRIVMGDIMNFALSAPRRETFLVSAIIAILVVIGMIVPLPFFTSYALGLLLIAYLILVAGVLIDGL